MADKIKIEFQRGNKANIPDIDNGKVTLTKDTNEIFMDTETERVPLGIVRGKGPNSAILTNPRFSEANGTYSVSGGNGTVANYNFQTVFGLYNIKDKNTLFTVGNGTSRNNRSNAFDVYTDGHADLDSQGITRNSVVIKDYLDAAINLKLNNPTTFGVDIYGTYQCRFTDTIDITQDSDGKILTINDLKQGDFVYLRVDKINCSPGDLTIKLNDYNGYICEAHVNDVIGTSIIFSSNPIQKGTIICTYFESAEVYKNENISSINLKFIGIVNDYDPNYNSESDTINDFQIYDCSIERTDTYINIIFTDRIPENKKLLAYVSDATGDLSNTTYLIRIIANDKKYNMGTDASADYRENVVKLDKREIFCFKLNEITSKFFGILSDKSNDESNSDIIDDGNIG